MESRPIKRALISVSDKSGLVDFAKELNAKTGGDLLTDEENVTELYIWYENDNNYAKADEFLIETSKTPSVYYNHQPGNGVYRAAIIGGDVISNEDSYYNNFYFFWKGALWRSVQALHKKH